MQTRISCCLFLLPFFLSTCGSRTGTVARVSEKHRKEKAIQIDAEKSLLDRDLWNRSPIKLRRLWKLYSSAYRNILTPNYQYQVTNDKQVQTRILLKAIGMCATDPISTQDLLQITLDKREVVRTRALSSLAHLAREYGMRDKIFSKLIEYLNKDLPTEYLALALSYLGYGFSGSLVPEKTLNRLAARSQGDSGEAGKYIHKAIRIIKDNENCLTRRIGTYPFIKFETREVPRT